ncbi:hypothetical protein [Bacillus paralicheniformis]|uniref:hypothetical protein n=1 Tax=Bacillus paralicheniformis TaxID=1648923 RepID=UPI003F7ADE37
MTKTNEKIHVLADESLGGIKREYVEVDRKAEKGEKIVIVNADVQSEDPYSNGDVFTIGESWSRGDGLTECGRLIFRREHRVLVPAESSEEEPQPSDPIDVIANLATRVAELERENKRIKEDLGWNEMGPGRIAELRNADSDIRHDIAALEERVDNDYEESDAWAGSVNEKMSRLQDEIDTLHKDNRRHGEELEALKYAAKETDGKVAHLEADIEESFPATDAPLVFICRKPGRFEVYQDGKKLHGVMSVRINAKVGEFATHEIEYISGATKEERQ